MAGDSAIRAKMAQLAEAIRDHQYRYYVLDKPVIEDIPTHPHLK
jgi:NAD-dependent DNA ligase